MAWFIISLVLGIAGIPLLIWGLLHIRKHKDRTLEGLNGYGRHVVKPHPGNKWFALAGLVASVLAFATFTLSVTTAVPAQNVGVVTSFGKPVGKPLDSGLHLKAPWHKVTDMDGTIQQENNVYEKNSDDQLVDTRTVVRLQTTNSQMFVKNQLRWRIKQNAAGTLFADWKSFDKIGPGLVQKQLAGALNEELALYDPLTIGAKNKSNEQIAADVNANLTKRFGKDIEVVGFTVIGVDFDEATQQRINDFQAEVARTRVAEQRKQTVTAEKDVNDKLATSVKDPNVLVSKCLDNQRTMIEKGQPLTGVPGCWPGQNGPVQTIPVK